MRMRMTLLFLLALALVLDARPAEANRAAKSRSADRGAASTGAKRAETSRSKKGPGAGRQKNQKLSRYASARERNGKGQFTRVPASQRAVRRGVFASALANPTPVGKSSAEIRVTPARTGRPGRLQVKIPEFYAGSAPLAAQTKPVQILARDIRGKDVVISGTLKVGAGRPGSSFRSASFEGSIPPGATLSRGAIQSAVAQSQLHVNRFSVEWRN
jgi:hypothetical protein